MFDVNSSIAKHVLSDLPRLVKAIERLAPEHQESVARDAFQKMESAIQRVVQTSTDLRLREINLDAAISQDAALASKEVEEAHV